MTIAYNCTQFLNVTDGEQINDGDEEDDDDHTTQPKGSAKGSQSANHETPMH